MRQYTAQITNVSHRIIPKNEVFFYYVIKRLLVTF